MAHNHYVRISSSSANGKIFCLVGVYFIGVFYPNVDFVGLGVGKDNVGFRSW